MKAVCRHISPSGKEMLRMYQRAPPVLPYTGPQHLQEMSDEKVQVFLRWKCPTGYTGSKGQMQAVPEGKEMV